MVWSRVKFYCNHEYWGIFPSERFIPTSHTTVPYHTVHCWSLQCQARPSWKAHNLQLADYSTKRQQTDFQNTITVCELSMLPARCTFCKNNRWLHVTWAAQKQWRAGLQCSSVCYFFVFGIPICGTSRGKQSEYIILVACFT